MTDPYAEAEARRLEFIDRIQEEGDKIASDLTEKLELPPGARVVYELDDEPIT